MAEHILKCKKCGKYTMNESCECGGTAVIARPPRYTANDPYAKYRRIAKQKETEL